jgi:hypothetical protein
MILRLLICGVVVGAMCYGAQIPACSLSGQAGEGPFDPSMVEFVTDLKPIGESPSASVQMIARVVGVRPLAIEVLDTDMRDQGGLHACAQRRIYSVDARLREILPQLKFNDLVMARMSFVYGGTDSLVLTQVAVISGVPAYFHPRSQDSVCANRAGTLTAYREPGGETAVYNDGSIYYRDSWGKVFDRQRLGPEELARLMQSFQKAGFETLANSMPPVDGTRGQPSLSLTCARYQRVLVSGNQSALAPVLRILQQVKTKALAEAYYFLRYEERREITFLEWPFPQLPIGQAGAKIRAVASEEFAARCANRPVPSDFRMFHQDLPAPFFHKLPASFSMNRDTDPNRDAYVRSGSRIYRVTWSKCTETVSGCRNLPQLKALTVDEGVTPVHLFTPPMDKPSTAPGAAAVTGCPVAPAAICRLPAEDNGCSLLVGIRSVLWPASAGVTLRDVPAKGRPITDAEYARDEALFRELRAAENCGQGIDFVEGRYWYRNVKMSHLDRAAPR